MPQLHKHLNVSGNCKSTIMRTTIIFLILIIFNTAYGQGDNPLAKLEFDKVVMYDFDGGKGSDLYIVDNKGQFAKSITKQVTLNKGEISSLNSKLGSKMSYGGGTASCFDPHLGFVYFLKGKIVGHVTVCLDCNRLSSSFDIPAQKQGKVGNGKDAYYIAEGLSTSFRQYLSGLLKANGFSHQIKNG
jgi:hypothetical protein